MEKKNIIIVAACGIVLAAFLAVAPDMTDEEREVIGGMLQSIRNLNMNLLNALQ